MPIFSGILKMKSHGLHHDYYPMRNPQGNINSIERSPYYVKRRETSESRNCQDQQEGS
jgi:hypothetical protein